MYFVLVGFNFFLNQISESLAFPNNTCVICLLHNHKTHKLVGCILIMKSSENATSSVTSYFSMENNDLIVAINIAKGNH